MRLLPDVLANLRRWLPANQAPSFGQGRNAPKRDRIKVGVLESWGNFDDALRRLTPGGSGCWDGVEFVQLSRCTAPDFILVLNSPPKSRRTTCRIAPERLWFACGEPPGWLHRKLHVGQGECSSVICCDEEVMRLSNGRTYFLEPPIAASWSVGRGIEDLASNAVVKKSKILSWVTSNLVLTKGHRYRMMFLERLMKEVQFDLFGRGFTQISDKWDGVAPYRYSIAFENTSSPCYFTEKIMDCFVCHTMPLYYGAPDIARYFPRKSFELIDPEDPKAFGRIREIMSSNLWETRMPYIMEAKELVLKKYNCFARLAAHFKVASARTASARKEIAIDSVNLDWNRALRE